MKTELMRAHREALQQMARMYDSSSAEGMASVAVFLGKAERLIGRIANDPHVPEELPDREPDTTEIRQD